MSKPQTDPAFADLSQDMALAIAGTPQDAMGPALAERVDIEAQAETDRAFGAAIRETITDAHGAQVAAAVQHAFTVATRPGTPARTLQNHIHRVLVPRLDRIVGEVAK